MHCPKTNYEQKIKNRKKCKKINFRLDGWQKKSNICVHP